MRPPHLRRRLLPWLRRGCRQRGHRLLHRGRLPQRPRLPQDLLRRRRLHQRRADRNVLGECVIAIRREDAPSHSPFLISRMSLPQPFNQQTTHIPIPASVLFRPQQEHFPSEMRSSQPPKHTARAFSHKYALVVDPKHCGKTTSPT